MTLNVTELDNGVRVVTDRVDSVESVTAGVWVGAGTRDEWAENNGVAHFLEHMAFKGTKQRTALDIAKAVENVGGHANAYTSRESTVYYTRMLREDVRLGMDILADILRNSVFDETDLERERHVILQEIGLCADTPDETVFDYFQEKAFPDQAMGWPILGRSEIICALPRHSLQSFMDKTYAPSRMIVAACGRIDHEDFLSLARDTFGDIPTNPPAVRPPARYVGGVDIRDRQELEQLHLVLGFQGVSHTDPDYYALNLGAAILGGGMSSNLFQEIREKRGLAYSIYAFSASYADSGIFGVYAGTGGPSGQEVLDVTCDEFKQSCDHIETTALDRAKAQIKAGLLMARESTHQRCEQNCQHILIHGRPLGVEELTQRVEAVEKKDVYRALERVFSTPPTLVAMGPAEGLAQTDTITGAFAR